MICFLWTIFSFYTMIKIMLNWNLKNMLCLWKKVKNVRELLLYMYTEITSEFNTVLNRFRETAIDQYDI